MTWTRVCEFCRSANGKEYVTKIDGKWFHRDCFLRTNGSDASETDEPGVPKKVEPEGLSRENIAKKISKIFEELFLGKLSPKEWGTFVKSLNCNETMEVYPQLKEIEDKFNKLPKCLNNTQKREKTFTKLLVDLLVEKKITLEQICEKIKFTVRSKIMEKSQKINELLSSIDQEELVIDDNDPEIGG